MEVWHSFTRWLVVVRGTKLGIVIMTLPNSDFVLFQLRLTNLHHFNMPMRIHSIMILHNMPFAIMYGPEISTGVPHIFAHIS